MINARFIYEAAIIAILAALANFTVQAVSSALGMGFNSHMAVFITTFVFYAARIKLPV